MHKASFWSQHTSEWLQYFKTLPDPCRASCFVSSDKNAHQEVDMNNRQWRVGGNYDELYLRAHTKTFTSNKNKYAFFLKDLHSLPGGLTLCIFRNERNHYMTVLISTRRSARQRLLLMWPLLSISYTHVTQGQLVIGINTRKQTGLWYRKSVLNFHSNPWGMWKH